MAKLVDAPDLGSGAARRGGSSPSTRTTLKNYLKSIRYPVSKVEAFTAVVHVIRPSQQASQQFCLRSVLQSSLNF